MIIQSVFLAIVFLPLLLFLDLCIKICHLFGKEVNDMDQTLFMALGWLILLLPVAAILDKFIVL